MSHNESTALLESIFLPGEEVKCEWNADVDSAGDSSHGIFSLFTRGRWWHFYGENMAPGEFAARLLEIKRYIEGKDKVTVEIKLP